LELPPLALTYNIERAETMSHHPSLSKFHATIDFARQPPNNLDLLEFLTTVGKSWTTNLLDLQLHIIDPEFMSHTAAYRFVSLFSQGGPLCRVSELERERKLRKLLERNMSMVHSMAFLYADEEQVRGKLAITRRLYLTYDFPGTRQIYEDRLSKVVRGLQYLRERFSALGMKSIDERFVTYGVDRWFNGDALPRSYSNNFLQALW
jgi:hypothetical protein